jgi:hypothetical protein
MLTPTPKARTLISQPARSFHRHSSECPRGLVRVIRRYQAYLFFPMLLLEGLNLHLASVRELAGRRTSPRRRTEAALLAAHFASYLALSDGQP